MAAIALGSKDPVTAALESFRAVETYSVTLDSNRGSEVIRYYYKKPGFVRMEFITPHKGAALVYDPFKKEVSLRPFGFLKPLVLRLSPENTLIRSPDGHTVDKSDIGELLRTVDNLRKNGSLTVIGDGEVNGRKATIVEVEGRPEDPSGRSMYRLWLEEKSMLPLKVESYDGTGKAEEVVMDDLEVNPTLPDNVFSID
ncbi:MAG: DUF1571 domain-containing protein [Deltaproteobacteria bacterium]|nr:DUF1571 domain-containing protein [Deltaproteobacteria bacterium]